MGENRGFRGLMAWQVGMDVIEETYRVTERLPDTERYGLVSQMRRASVSIPSNVAEGYPVNAPKWTLRYIQTAIGSSCELDTQLEVAVRLRFCTAKQAAKLLEMIDRVQKLLYGMKREKERRLIAAGATVSVLLLAVLRQVI